MDYTNIPEFEWNPVKDRQCEKQRGFSFTFASRVFFAPKTLVLPDNRHEYEEDRFQLFAPIHNRLYCVVFIYRGKNIRIISARKANQREVNKHGYRLLQTRS